MNHVDPVNADAQFPLLVYLDHSDLVNIADGKARDVDVLKHAMDVSGANLLISSVHLIDLDESTPATKVRWIDAITHVAPIQFATEPGSHVPLDRDGVAALIDEAAADVGTVRPVLKAEQEARAVKVGVPKPKVSNKRVREIVESLLDGNLDQISDLDNAVVTDFVAVLPQLRAAMESLGVDRATVLSGLFPKVEDALATGNISEVVRLRRLQDYRRKPQDTDAPDEWHLQFAIHADLFTVDGNVAHVMQSISGRSVPIHGRPGRAHGQQVYVYQSGQLAAVARVVLALSGQL
jgi:hypothetical protein